MAGKNKPVRRYRQFKDRRLEILRPAASAFTRSGFAHATMEDIADRVQMAKGNLYYYFPSKQDLLFFCQDESLAGAPMKRARSANRNSRPMNNCALCDIDALLDSGNCTPSRRRRNVTFAPAVA